jgi:hypothetical protein
VGCLNPGDTLFIRGGTYGEPIDIGQKSGTVGNYITIAAYPSEKVTIAPAGYAIVPRALVHLIFDGLVLDGVNAINKYFFTIDYGSHDVIVRNLEIKNWKGNGIIVGANNIEIRNNNIHNQVSECGCSGERWYGIYFHHGTNGLIEGNQIHNNPGGGIQAYPGTITNLVIRGNSIHDNGYLDSSPVGGMVIAEDGVQSVTGVQVYNNLVYRNGVGQSTVNTSHGIRISTGPDGTKVWNNTVYGNNGWGLNIQAGTNPPRNTVVQNNIIWANTSGQIVDAGIGSMLNSNLTNNPNFANAAAFDFTLQASSAAIDAGVPLTQVSMDIRGRPRPQGATHDIGAHEAGSASASAPKPPQGLRVY